MMPPAEGMARLAARFFLPALIVWIPTVLAFATLAAARLVQPLPALLGAVAVFAALLVMLGPVIAGFHALRDAIGRLEEDGEEPAKEPAGATGIHPAFDDLRHGLWRLARRWRQRLLESEAALAGSRAILAQLPDPLILIDERRRIIRANPAAKGFFGANLAGRDLAGALRNPLVLAAVDAVLRGEAGGAVEFSQAVPVNRDLRAHIVPLASPGPDGARVVLTLQDLTAAKRSERMRADFAANASHELRTPLATLLGFIETLRGPARDDVEAQARFLGIMHEQATRMARLVEDLLSLSRIEMNEHVSPSEKVDIAEIVVSVAATLELRAKTRQMAIELDLEEGLPEIIGAGDELAQVFLNLIDNAVKYGRPGTPIQVAVHTDDGDTGGGDTGEGDTGEGDAVDGDSVEIDRDIVISIRDQGEGIEAQHIPRLTERFYRVDTARSREMGGTGLGLAIVKHIVARHRGTLDISSEPGKGSVFTVRLHGWTGSDPSAVMKRQ